MTATLFGAVALLAQDDSGYDAKFVELAAKDIGRIETAYDAAKDYLFGAGTLTGPMKRGIDDLGVMRTSWSEMTASLEALGIREQVLFTIGRCENFANMASRTTVEDKSNVFTALASFDLREYCAVQIQASKLRLIDYAVEYGVNPFD